MEEIANTAVFLASEFAKSIAGVTIDATGGNRRIELSSVIECHQGVHRNFGSTSVRFKSEINDAFPRKRHQKRHLDFCAAHLLMTAH